MFARMKPHRTTFRWSETPSLTNSLKLLKGPSGTPVNESCNSTITLQCLQQIYNAVGTKGSSTNGNGIAVTGYMEQFANLDDLKLFYEDQNPSAAATNASFKFISVSGNFIF